MAQIFNFFSKTNCTWTFWHRIYVGPIQLSLTSSELSVLALSKKYQNKLPKVRLKYFIHDALKSRKGNCECYFRNILMQHEFDDNLILDPIQRNNWTHATHLIIP
jgi:hypothetical protein